MRSLIILISLLVVPVISAEAQINVDFSIGVNVPEFPELVTVPGYPVYYDPNMDSNYFFYDGQYWVYDNDNWYTSDWYNGPWTLVEPEFVPMFILRVPVRYYHHPPVYFRDWRADEPPRWGEHWGRDWEERHRDWNRWNHQSAPRPAPLPEYQRRYSGDRYPHGAERHAIRDQEYHYQPHDPVVQQVVQKVRANNGGRSNNAAQSQQSHSSPPMRRQFEPRPDERVQRQSSQHSERPSSPTPPAQDEHRPPVRDEHRNEHRDESRNEHRDEPHPQPHRPPPPRENKKPPPKEEHKDHEDRG